MAVCVMSGLDLELCGGGGLRQAIVEQTANHSCLCGCLIRQDGVSAVRFSGLISSSDGGGRERWRGRREEGGRCYLG